MTEIILLSQNNKEYLRRLKKLKREFPQVKFNMTPIATINDEMMLTDKEYEELLELVSIENNEPLTEKEKKEIKRRELSDDNLLKEFKFLIKRYLKIESKTFKLQKSKGSNLKSKRTNT